jgi:hypothetical protein
MVFPEEEDFEKFTDPLEEAIKSLAKAQTHLENTFTKITYAKSYPIEIRAGYNEYISALIEKTETLYNLSTKAYQNMARDLNKLDEWQMERKSEGWFSLVLV